MTLDNGNARPLDVQAHLHHRVAPRHAYYHIILRHAGGPTIFPWLSLYGSAVEQCVPLPFSEGGQR